MRVLIVLALSLVSLLSRADEHDQLYQLAGWAQQREHFGAALAAAQQRYRGTLPPALYQALVDNSNRRFAAAAMETRALDSLRAQLPDPLPAIRFFDSPLGRAVVLREVQATAPAALAQHADGLPPGRRQRRPGALVQRLGRVLPAREAGAEVSLALAGVAADSLSQMLPGLPRTARQRWPRAAARPARGSVWPEKIDADLENTLLHVYRDLSDAQLGEFVAFADRSKAKPTRRRPAGGPRGAAGRAVAARHPALRGVCAARGWRSAAAAGAGPLGLQLLRQAVQRPPRRERRVVAAAGLRADHSGWARARCSGPAAVPRARPAPADAPGAAASCAACPRASRASSRRHWRAPSRPSTASSTSQLALAAQLAFQPLAVVAPGSASRRRPAPPAPPPRPGSGRQPAGRCPAPAAAPAAIPPPRPLRPAASGFPDGTGRRPSARRAAAARRRRRPRRGSVQGSRASTSAARGRAGRPAGVRARPAGWRGGVHQAPAGGGSSSRSAISRVPAARRARRCASWSAISRSSCGAGPLQQQGEALVAGAARRPAAAPRCRSPPAHAGRGGPARRPVGLAVAGAGDEVEHRQQRPRAVGEHRQFVAVLGQHRLAGVDHV